MRNRWVRLRTMPRGTDAFRRYGAGRVRNGSGIVGAGPTDAANPGVALPSIEKAVREADRRFSFYAVACR